jgi:hypothetical protein
VEKKMGQLLGGSVEIMVQWAFQNTVHRADSVPFKCSMLPGFHVDGAF